MTCPVNKLQQSAFWVGIDGFAPADPTVQQIGTDADCLKDVKSVPGGPVHYAWFEMYPGALVVLNPSTYPVHPGDSLTASVTLVGTNFVLALIDAGHWTFATTQPVGTPTPLNSSREWITEAPSFCSGGSCKALPLANFGSVAFFGATVNGLPVNGTGLTSSQITMVKNKEGHEHQGIPFCAGRIRSRVQCQLGLELTHHGAGPGAGWPKLAANGPDDPDRGQKRPLTPIPTGNVAGSHPSRATAWAKAKRSVMPAT